MLQAPALDVRESAGRVTPPCLANVEGGLLASLVRSSGSSLCCRILPVGLELFSWPAGYLVLRGWRVDGWGLDHRPGYHTWPFTNHGEGSQGM